MHAIRTSYSHRSGMASPHTDSHTDYSKVTISTTLNRAEAKESELHSVISWFYSNVHRWLFLHSFCAVWVLVALLMSAVSATSGKISELERLCPHEMEGNALSSKPSSFMTFAMITLLIMAILLFASHHWSHEMFITIREHSLDAITNDTTVPKKWYHIAAFKKHIGCQFLFNFGVILMGIIAQGLVNQTCFTNLTSENDRFAQVKTTLHFFQFSFWISAWALFAVTAYHVMFHA